MKNYEVLITDCDHANIDIETELFNKASIPFNLQQCKTVEDVIRHGKNAKVLINQYAPITDKVIQSLPELRLVVRYGVGVNNVDLKSASSHGVQVCNVPDYGTQEVADHALALMLSLTRKINLMNNLVRNGIWDYQKGIPIFRHSEQTVGIIGAGRIGRAFANKVKHLGCKLLCYDPKYLWKKEDEAGFIEFVDLPDLLAQSDVISVHCPLDSAHNLIGEAEMKIMKPTSYLINVSRGGIVNERALEEALKNRWIAGAAADVSETEPLDKESPLLQHENFICTPHMGWYSEEAAQELKRKVAEESIRFLKGFSVHYPVNEIK